jgi:hypothetical protein
VRGVHNGLGDFALKTRHADVKPCSEEVNVARNGTGLFRHRWLRPPEA